jgi:hypothetical protein
MMMGDDVMGWMVWWDFVFVRYVWLIDSITGLPSSARRDVFFLLLVFVSKIVDSLYGSDGSYRSVRLVFFPNQLSVCSLF